MKLAVIAVLGGCVGITIWQLFVVSVSLCDSCLLCWYHCVTVCCVGITVWQLFVVLVSLCDSLLCRYHCMAVVCCVGITV